MADIDWLTLKTQYLTSDISYRQLGKKFGIPFKQIAKHGVSEGWVGQRGQYKDNVVTKTLDIESSKVADKLSRLMEAEELLEGAVIHRLKDEDIEAQDINYLAQAIVRAVASRRNLWSIPTETELEARHIAAERLELEKRKVEGGAEDNIIQVIMSPELEEYAK